MTAQEMHIEIDLELQKINSQSTKNIQPHEKDWFLNNEVIDYLKQKIYPTSNIKKIGFQDNAKRVEDIKDFIRRSSRIVKTNNEGKQYITLPFDYFGWVRFDSNSIKKCNSIDTPKSTNNVYVNTFSIDVPVTILSTFKVELVTTNNTYTLFDLSDLPSDYLVNDTLKKQKFLLVKALKILLIKKLKELVSPDTELYWEKRGYSHVSDSFIIVSPVPFNAIRVTSNNLPVNITSTYIEASVQYSRQHTLLKAKLRVSDDEYLTDIENSSLSKSKASSPVGVLREGVLELSAMQSAIYGSIDITYVCVPNLIDLLLSSNLEVSEGVAKEIVGNTIRKLKGIVESQDYQTYAQENILTE